MDGFGARLVHARQVAGLTQSALARRAEIASEAAISKYERDELAPRSETMSRLADALTVSMDWLAAGRGTAPKARPTTKPRSNPKPRSKRAA